MSPTAQLLGATRNSRSRMVRISTAERRKSSRRAVRNVVRGFRGELNSVSQTLSKMVRCCSSTTRRRCQVHQTARPTPQYQGEHRGNHAVDLYGTAKEQPPSPRVGLRQIHDIGDETDREAQLDHPEHAVAIRASTSTRQAHGSLGIRQGPLQKYLRPCRPSCTARVGPQTIPLKSAVTPATPAIVISAPKTLRATSLFVRNTSLSTGAQVASSMQKNATTLSSP